MRGAAIPQVAGALPRDVEDGLLQRDLIRPNAIGAGALPEEAKEPGPLNSPGGVRRGAPPQRSAQRLAPLEP